MADFPHSLGLQAQKQAQALIKALGKSGVHLRWRTTSGKTPLEINNVLNSFAYSVAGQCYDETQVQRYVQLVSKIGFEKTKLAAETPIGSVYCMPIDAVAYRRWQPKSKEHLTVFVSEGIMPDGRFLVSTITHTPLRSKNNLVVKHIDYPGVDSISYIPCDSNYQYMRTEIYNLYLDDPAYEHEYTAKTKRKFRIKEALAITDALKSITLDGLILLTSKYHNFYELHAAISAFSNGGEERDLHIFESIQQSYYTLRYSLPVKCYLVLNYLTQKGELQ